MAASTVATVDPDFKDGELYEVFCPEGSDEPWRVVVSIQENGKFTQWALMQMLQAKDWEVDFEWAVFMKTGRCGSSGLRHFSKKFTDGPAAFKTFADWFEDKTGNKWLGDFTTTQEQFAEVAGKYILLTAEMGKSVLEYKGEKERARPKLGISDVPVDIYFKDREQYQVYVKPEDELWTAVMSVKEGDRHSQYAILQVLVAKADVKVEFDFVVFMRHGKLGGSAQRYAKRYTVEAAATSTFSQWFKEKTANEWYGSFKETLEDFSPVHGKFTLLPRSEWAEVVEFEERSQIQLIDSDVPVDAYYRDRDSYRVYHTDTGELWATVLSRKDDASGFYKRYVVLQMLAKKPSATVDFDFVVLRRIGERGESGQWTAKKFTNELDALRTFKMWYQDETGNQWKGSFDKSLAEFKPMDDKLLLLVQSEWEEAIREVPRVYDACQMASRNDFESILAEGRRSRIMQAGASGPQKVSIDILKRALAAEETKEAPAADIPEEAHEIAIPRSVKQAAKSVPKTVVEETPRAPISTVSGRTAGQDVGSPPTKDLAQGKKRPPTAQSHSKLDEPVKLPSIDVVEQDDVDPCFEHRDNYQVFYSTKMIQKDAAGKTRFYTMQLLSAREEAKLPNDEKYCFFVRTGRLGATGASNFRLIGNLETGKKSFNKKFLEKTKNHWFGDFDKTMPHFVPAQGEFELVKSFAS